MAGVVLSQPESKTTPSMGRPLIISSTSIDIKFRQNMEVGDMKNSPSEMVGNSIGNPPAARIPRFTCSARPRKWLLQCVASDQELAIPMTGFPEKDSSDQPWFFKPARCRNPSRSLVPNHSSDRRTSPLFPFWAIYPVPRVWIDYGRGGESSKHDCSICLDKYRIQPRL